MSNFKIAAAQVASVRGDLDRNIRAHAAAMEAAAGEGVSVLVFPELSLMGYELDLAGPCAISERDPRLSPLAELARWHRMDVIVGASLASNTGKPGLGAIRLAADGARHTYRKMHLGGDEPQYFAPGDRPHSFRRDGQTIGLAICADSSRPSHPQAYADAGCSIYAGGVFLNAAWYESDMPRWPAHAARFQMLVVMANHAASIGTEMSVGKSAIWAPGGALLAQAAGIENCLVVASCTGDNWRGEVFNSNRGLPDA